MNRSNSTKKNVILLIIDSLRPDRLGCFGHTPSPSPELDRLSKNSLFCTNTFTLGNTTEFSLPGFLASSFLLDDGGYAKGIANRKITLAEVLKEDGYKTSAFFSCYQRSASKYDRGFDEFFKPYDPNIICKDIGNIVPFYQKMYSNSLMTEKECVEALIPYFDNWLDDAIDHCAYLNDLIKNPIIPKSLIFSNYDFEKFGDEIKNEWKCYKQDKRQYIVEILKGSEFDLIKIIGKFVDNRIKKAPISWEEVKVRTFLLKNIYHVWKYSTSYKSSKKSVAHTLYRALHGLQSKTKWPSTGFFLESFKRWINSFEPTTPFFSFIHLLDVHELNVFSYDFDEKKERKNKEIEILKTYFKKVKGNSNKYQGHLLYDYAIQYVDHEIKLLMKFLEEKKLLHDTIVVISADHGHNFPNIPLRDGVSQPDHFFDELHHIPLLFINPEIKPLKYDGLVSSIDIAPTILDFLNIPIPASFKGYSINSLKAKARNHVLMENQGRGPCDLLRKPIRISVRSDKYKIVYEAPPTHASQKNFITEIYDIKEDAQELNNLVNNENYIQLVNPLLAIAEKRIMEIREHSVKI